MPSRKPAINLPFPQSLCFLLPNRGAVCNVLLTCCKDSVCRLWAETLLPGDSLLSGHHDNYTPDQQSDTLRCAGAFGKHTSDGKSQGKTAQEVSRFMSFSFHFIYSWVSNVVKTFDFSLILHNDVHTSLKTRWKKSIFKTVTPTKKYQCCIKVVKQKQKKTSAESH